MSQGYQVAYIVSMTHSGSTLLDSLLGAHSEAIGIGEGFQLPSYAKLNRLKSSKMKLGNQCTCGAETIWQCPFWTAVEEALQSIASKSLRDLQLNSQDPQRFAEDNRLFYDAIAKVSGARVIVDSSKSINRYKRLRRSGFADVRPIFLLRDPRGQVYSIMKRTGTSEFLPALRYCKNTVRMILKLWNDSPITVSYTSLSTKPRETLADVMRQLGLSIEDGQLDWSHTVRHNLAGNAMRAQSDVRIRPDESWVAGLRRTQANNIRLLAGPAQYLAMCRWHF